MTQFTTLLSGLVMVESPRWHDDRLVFSDWGSGEVLAVGLDGAREVITHIDTIPFCLDRLPDGRLLVVAGDELLVRGADGTLRPLRRLESALHETLERHRVRRSRQRVREQHRLRLSGR